MEFLTLKIEKLAYATERFNPLILEKIDEALKNKEKVFILAARKGTASGIMCWDCGFVLKCNFCESPLTFYEGSTGNENNFSNQQSNFLICRHCAKTYTPPSVCPNCQGTNFKYFGYGVMDIKKNLERLFPQAPIFTISKDSIKSSETFKEKVEKFNREGGILIGTEILIKENFPENDLSVIFLLEQLMLFPDYKIRERVRKIINFLSDRTKSLIIQSFDPENEFLRLIKDPDAFYRHELLNRKLFFLPPFSVLAKIKIKDKNQNKALREISVLRNKLEEKIYRKNLKIEVLGPIPSFIPKINNFWIFELVLKIAPETDLEDRAAIFSLASPRFIIDVEPRSLI